MNGGYDLHLYDYFHVFYSDTLCLSPDVFESKGHLPRSQFLMIEDTPPQKRLRSRPKIQFMNQYVGTRILFLMLTVLVK